MTVRKKIALYSIPLLLFWWGVIIVISVAVFPSLKVVALETLADLLFKTEGIGMHLRFDWTTARNKTSVFCIFKQTCIFHILTTFHPALSSGGDSCSSTYQLIHVLAAQLARPVLVPVIESKHLQCEWCCLSGNSSKQRNNFRSPCPTPSNLMPPVLKSITTLFSKTSLSQ